MVALLAHVPFDELDQDTPSGAWVEECDTAPFGTVARQPRPANQPAKGSGKGVRSAPAIQLLSESA